MSLPVSGGVHALHTDPWGHGLQVTVPGVERAPQPWDVGALSPGITAVLPEPSYAPGHGHQPPGLRLVLS